MNELRWILAGFGLILLGVIYAWGKFSRAETQKAAKLSDWVDLEDGDRDNTSGSAARAEPVFDESALRSPIYADRRGGGDSPAEQPVDRWTDRSAGLDEETGPFIADSDIDVDIVAESSISSDPALRAEPLLSGHDSPEGTTSGPSAWRDASSSDPAANAAVGDSPGRHSSGRVEPTFTEEELPPRLEESDDGFNRTAPLPRAERPRQPAGEYEAAREAVRPKQSRKIMTLRLAAAPLERYEGARLRASLQGEALQHGKYGIFHSLDGSGASRFSVASMVEPGTFDLNTMDQQHYTGITFFTLLPGPADGVEIFEDMTGCAYRLAQGMGGMLQDERGAPLTQRRYNQLREEVAVFERALSEE